MVCGVVNHVATVESAVVKRNALTLPSHVRAGYHAAAVRAAPPQIDKWHIALPHRHDVGARQFPLATVPLHQTISRWLPRLHPVGELSLRWIMCRARSVAATSLSGEWASHR
jgi:hypothetical protein